MEPECSLPHLQVPASCPNPRIVCPFHNVVLFLRWGVVSTSPNTQGGGAPLVGCPWLLIRYIRTTIHILRPFLRPHAEDVSCRGDRDLLFRYPLLICRVLRWIHWERNESLIGVSFGLNWQWRYSKTELILKLSMLVTLNTDLRQRCYTFQ